MRKVRAVLPSTNHSCGILPQAEDIPVAAQSSGLGYLAAEMLKRCLPVTQGWNLSLTLLSRMLIL